MSSLPETYRAVCLRANQARRNRGIGPKRALNSRGDASHPEKVSAVCASGVRVMRCVRMAFGLFGFVAGLAALTAVAVGIQLQMLLNVADATPHAVTVAELAE